MTNKFNNNLFKVTNEEKNYIHYFTSMNRVGQALGAQQGQLKYYYYLQEKPYKGYFIELVDGSEIKWKDID